MSPGAKPAATLSRFDRLLRPFGKVEPGEGALAALMLLCVFLILTGYYVMKTAREGLILTTGGHFGLHGAELKAYASGAMSAVLIALVPLYGKLVAHVRRIRLITVSYVVVILSLIVFYALAHVGAPIGLAYFVWLGIVSLFLIAQFWSYANDIYSEEQGKRLFAIIAIGGSIGAIAGPQIANLGNTSEMLLVAAAIVGVCLVLFHVIERLTVRNGLARQGAHEPVAGADGFALVLQDRYLMLIAGLVLAANLVNAIGEYILSSAVTTHAAALFPAAHAPGGSVAAGVVALERREYIKTFYGDFFFVVNLAAFAIQAFLVSRVIKQLGVRVALFALPVIAFGAYGVIAAVGGLAVVRAAKVAENGTDYSLQNTVRQTLFLPTDRAAKYKAKAATDTFFVRIGDTIAAVTIGLGIHRFGFDSRSLALVNLVLIGVWIAIVVGISRRYRALAARAEAREAAPVVATPDRRGWDGGGESATLIPRVAPVPAERGGAA